MKTILIVPDTRPTYDLFRRRVLHFIATAKAANLEGAPLRAALDDAIRGWRAEGFPKSWLAQARRDVLRDEPAPSRPAQKPARGRASSSCGA